MMQRFHTFWNFLRLLDGSRLFFLHLGLSRDVTMTSLSGEVQSWALLACWRKSPQASLSDTTILQLRILPFLQPGAFHLATSALVFLLSLHLGYTGKSALQVPRSPSWQNYLPIWAKRYLYIFDYGHDVVQDNSSLVLFLPRHLSPWLAHNLSLIHI